VFCVPAAYHDFVKHWLKNRAAQSKDLIMADEKKIIIDEDWKSQVQAEKEAASKSKPAAAAEPAQRAAPEPAGAAPMQMPPASLEMLLTMLATEALAALGQIPHPATGQAQVDRGQAQYLIDLIDVLREKTKGNLDAREEQLMETLLHQLRMAFIETTNQPAT
jgi:3-oxoacyl-ACP reductase-like protein